MGVGHIFRIQFVVYMYNVGMFLKYTKPFFPEFGIHKYLENTYFFNNVVCIILKYWKEEFSAQKN